MTFSETTAVLGQSLQILSTVGDRGVNLDPASQKNDINDTRIQASWEYDLVHLIFVSKCPIPGIVLPLPGILSFRRSLFRSQVREFKPAL